MGTPDKRKNRTDDEHVLLLRQVSADTPFFSKRGSDIESWEDVAAKLSVLSAFSRLLFDGKKAQNRFLSLMGKHRKYNIESAAKSGVSKCYSEKHELLDDQLPVYDDHEQAKATRAEKERKKREDGEVKGARAREASKVSLGKREVKGDEGNAQQDDKRNRYRGMIAMTAQDLVHCQL